MMTKTNMTLAAMLVLGSASFAVAGEGSPDLSGPWGSSTTYAAPRTAAPFAAEPPARRIERRVDRENTGYVQRRATDFSSRDQIQREREEDWPDIN